MQHTHITAVAILIGIIFFFMTLIAANYLNKIKKIEADLQELNIKTDMILTRINNGDAFVPREPLTCEEVEELSRLVK